MVDGVVKHPVRRPETEERDSRLHENTLQDMAMHMMPEFVRQHGFDFVGECNCRAECRPE